MFLLAALFQTLLWFKLSSPAKFLRGLFYVPCSGFPALNEHTSLQLTLLFPMFSFGSPMRLKVSGSHGLSPDCTAKDFYFRSLIRETVGGWPSQGHFYPLKCFGLPIQQLLIRLLMWRSLLGLVDLSLFRKKNRKYILFLTTFIKYCLFSYIKDLVTHLSGT